jgi:hypothetical protein
MEQVAVSTLNKVWDSTVDPLFNAIGCGAKYSPARRFIVIGLGTAVILWTMKPQALFDDKGRARPWSITGSTVGGTVLDWKGISLLTGTMAALFV